MNLKNLRTYVVAMMLVVTMFFHTACPKDSQIEKASKTSLQLAQLTRDAIAGTRKAFENNLITLETKDKMAAQLDLVISGGQTFNAAVKEVYDRYKANGQLDLPAMQLLDAMLTQKVVTPFLAFLEHAKVINAQQAPELWAAINVLRQTLLMIGSFMSKRTEQMLDVKLDQFNAAVFENKRPLGEVWLYARKLC